MKLRYLSAFINRLLQISIENSLVCDFMLNCDYGEDEMSCDDDGRFYCESGTPLFVRRQQVNSFSLYYFGAILKAGVLMLLLRT